MRDLFDFDMLSRQGLIAGASLQIFLSGITAPALLVGWPEFAPGVASSVERNGTVPGARRLSAREALCVMSRKSRLERLNEESIEPDILPDAQSCPVQADLGQIYRDEAPRLASYFRRRLREPEEQHDLVQESFARLAGFMARQPLISPGPYLQSIARNLLFERARQRRRKMAAFHVPIGEGSDPTIAPDQAHRIEARDVMRIYCKALDELPERTREIFLLHRAEDLTYKAIGARLGVSIPTVPTIRATVFGIMLFMIPVALLFILTPINLRVASFALGLFVFVALWGVIDAGLHQLTLGRASDVLAELRANALGANAWLLAPSAAMKALAIFGSFRTAAAGLAGAFVFTVFRFSGNVFTGFTGGALNVMGQGSAAAAPLSTGEGYASALEAQASASGTRARAAATSTFGDFGERSSFGASRAFGEAGHILGERPGTMGGTALAIGKAEGARQLGSLSPALNGRDLADPQVARAVQANAATSAIHQFAEKDALRTLGTGYFGSGETGEKAFAAFAQNLVQWRAFGDQRAYGMMMQGAKRHFERAGYIESDAELKASGVIGQAQSDPAFAKLIANAFEQEQLLANELTQAQTNVGAMQGRRDFAGDQVTQVERGNVAIEQALRTGANDGQQQAAQMLGLEPRETSRRIGFINALTGEARSSAMSQLAKATGRDEAQVLRAVESFNASTQVGTADGATAEAGRERTSVYRRTREAAGHDFADRSGKLDAQREVGPTGTRAAARIGEQRRQSDNFGFAQGASAAGSSTREAARLDSFIQSLSRTAGNQVDMAEGGAGGVADRSRNDRLTRIVQNERLSRMQAMLRAEGIAMPKKSLAMAENGDLGLNLTPAQARQFLQAGLITDSQFGALSKGGHARFSFADNDLLVSSSAAFQQSSRHDTSTRFEAGKQAGPDTIEHFMGGGEDGHAIMANWLRGGFEMDRKGEWRLKPQVADTLQRDLQAVMVQTGWQRTLSRNAEKQSAISTSVSAAISGGLTVDSVTGSSRDGRRSGGGRSPHGSAGASIGLESRDQGLLASSASSSLDILNYDVREAIAAAEKIASRSSDPERAFSGAIADRLLGKDGLRNLYLEEAASGRGTWDWVAPITSVEQSSILDSGRLSTDRDQSSGDGNATHKVRKD